jgi:hypothetical protein
MAVGKTFDCGEKCGQVVKALLERGADCNKENFSGRTALHSAAHTGHVSIVKLLLQSGADILAKDNDGLYPLDMSVSGGHHEVSRLLQALHWAAHKEDKVNKTLLQSAMKREMDCIERERMSRDRQYKAVRAYEEWMERKSLSQGLRVDPGACQYRLEQRAKEGQTQTCRSCQQSRSTSHSTYTAHHCHIRPINISLVQADKNLQHVGKPGRIYPYTNYPALRKRCYTADIAPIRTASKLKKTSSCHKKPHSVEGKSQDTVVGSQDIVVGGSQDTIVSGSHATLVGRSKENARDVSSVESPKSKPPPLDLSQISYVSNVPSELDASVPNVPSELDASVPNVLDDDLPDSPGELTFHEVEQNSLRGITSSAYIQQVVGSSRHLVPINSLVTFHNHRHNAYRGKLQRRLSLGSIPEGRMVRSYSSGSDELLDLWGEVAWGVGVSNHHRSKSAPASPVTDSDVLDSALLALLHAAPDRREELKIDVCSDDSDSGDSSDSGDGCGEEDVFQRPDTPLPAFNADYAMCSPGVVTPPPSSPHNLSSPSSPLLHANNSHETIPTSPTCVTTPTSFQKETPPISPAEVTTPTSPAQGTTPTSPAQGTTAVGGPPTPTAVWTDKGYTSSAVKGPLSVSGGQIFPVKRESSKQARKIPSALSLHNRPNSSSSLRSLSTSNTSRSTSQMQSASSRHTMSTSYLRTSTSQEKVPLKPTVMAFGGSLQTVDKKVPLVYSSLTSYH